MTSDENAVAKAAEYSRTPEEEAATTRILQSPESPRIKVIEKGGTRMVTVDHPDPVVGDTILAEALGTTDFVYLQGVLNQLARTTSAGGVLNERALNFMLSIVTSLKPKNEMEGMLAVQMAAVQMATMTAFQRLSAAKTVQEQDIAHRAVIKLTRTFLAQLDAWKRLRTSNVQRIVVEHVMGDADGGRAILEGSARSRAPASGPAASARLSHTKEPPVLDEAAGGCGPEPEG